MQPLNTEPTSLRKRIGATRFWVMSLLILAGAFSFAFHALSSYKMQHSALLYILVPYSLSLVIAWYRPYGKTATRWAAYRKHLVSALIVFFATSVLLREGFICVLFFLPIYIVFITFGFLIYHFAAGNKTYSTVLPGLIVILSLEGTNPLMTFPRETTVISEAIVELSLEQIHENLSKPIDLQGKRHWFLQLFPMPERIESGAIFEGAVHRVHTRYQRWFFTNTHTGTAELLMTNVTPKHINAEIRSDTTYFSTYLGAKEIDVVLTPITDTQTKVQFAFRFERKLDPAWYFHPLQRYAAKKMGQFTIQEVISRDRT